MNRPALATFVVFTAVASAAPGIDTEAATARQAFADGVRALAANDLGAAEAAFGRAAALLPDWALAHLQLGVTRTLRDPDDERGLADLERAVGLDAENARGHFVLGLAYERRGRYDDAAKELRAALQRRPDLVEALYALGRVVAQTGPATDAIDLYRRILLLEPRHVGALASLAALYEDTGALPQAEGALIAITRLHPDVAYHRYRLAQFYRRIGDEEKAQQALAQLEALDPRERKMRALR